MFWTCKMGMRTLDWPPVWRLAPVSHAFCLIMCFLNQYSAIMVLTLMYYPPFYLFKKASAICWNYSFVLILKRFSESTIDLWVSLNYRKSMWQIHSYTEEKCICSTKVRYLFKYISEHPVTSEQLLIVSYSILLTYFWQTILGWHFFILHSVL